MLQVNVNYNIDYLPDDVHSTNLRSFGGIISFSIPNARVTFPASDIQEALEIKKI